VKFLTVDSDHAIARTPMERQAKAAGARFEVRDGWNVAVSYPGLTPETGWADVSHIQKIEIRGHSLPLGAATRIDGAWWCPLTDRRALVIGPSDADADGVDVTSAFAALTLVGPSAREIFARFTALDLRDATTPVHAFRPGSIARQPGLLLREADDRWLFLFGWAIGEYMWTVVEDAARHLGGGPIGLDELPALEHAEPQVQARA
jgi:glycine cleavage system aminomethyltransferase T